MKIDTRAKLQKVLLKTVDVKRNDYLIDEYDNEIKYEIMELIVFCLGWWHSFNTDEYKIERMIKTLKKINKDMLTKNRAIALKEYNELDEILNELED